MNPDGIPEKWLAPIGRNMVLSPGIVGITPPPTIDAFSDMICEMSRHIILDPQPAKSFEPRPVHARAIVRAARSQEAPSKEVTFPGTFAEWPEAIPDKHALVIDFKFKIDKPGRYVVMFNTKSQVIVEVDGRLAFRRAAGDMAPSFHRAPWNQEAFLEFSSAGEHTLRATIQRVAPGARPNWVVGVAYGDSLQWVPDAML